MAGTLDVVLPAPFRWRPPEEVEDPVAVRPARLLAVGALSVALLTGCGLLPDSDSASEPPTATDSASPEVTTSTPAELAEFYDQRVRWSNCDGDFDCTTVKVPLDYANPSAGTIGLDVVRLKAKDPKGSLLLNPGGPGGSGVEYARAARVVLTEKLVNSYDIIGFDPRGVVNSDPVDCVDDSLLDEYFAADVTPDDATEVAELATESKEVGQGCLTRSPDLAPYIDTESAARDMDIIRAVVGDEKLNYLGKSYGTYLGATYAELFPERVGRMVLDGVLPSSLNSDELTFGQAKAFDMVFRRFVADCLTQDDCPLSGDVDAGVAQVQQFLAGLDANPLPGMGDRVLTQGMATNAILNYLYAPPIDWEVLRYGLDVAFQGDGSVLMEILDDRLDRKVDGGYANNSNEAFLAVACLDRPSSGGIEHAAELAKEWAKDAPVFGPSMAWTNVVCSDWPVKPANGDTAGTVIHASGAAPILVVSTKYDPATPYEWGVQVADELDSATLLTYDGDGHTAYTSGSSCIDDAVDAYYLNGTMPAEGTVCAPD